MKIPMVMDSVRRKDDYSVEGEVTCVIIESKYGRQREATIYVRVPHNPSAFTMFELTHNQFDMDWEPVP